MCGWMGVLRSCASKWSTLVLSGLDKKNALWAYSRGEPFRPTSALELMATVLAVRIFGVKGPLAGGECSFGLTSFTRNQSCGHLMGKLMTTKYRLCLILLQLCDECDPWECSLI